MEHAFEDIEVKENAIDLLEYALTHKRKKCMIGTGSMTDPYIPLELEIGNVRKALNLIYEHGFGFYLRFFEENNDSRQLSIWHWEVR